MLNRKVQITQSDIEAKNGMLYTIDSVLLPAGVSTLPNKCDNYTYKLVKVKIIHLTVACLMGFFDLNWSVAI